MERNLEHDNDQLRNDVRDLQAIVRYLEKRNEELVQLLYGANQYIKEKEL